MERKGTCHIKISALEYRIDKRLNGDSRALSLEGAMLRRTQCVQLPANTCTLSRVNFQLSNVHDNTKVSVRGLVHVIIPEHHKTDVFRSWTSGDDVGEINS